MFEAVALRRSTDIRSVQSIDVGSLAEAILFYGRVDLVISRGMVLQLLTTCGPETTLRLVEDGYVVPRYTYWNPGIYTENAGTTTERHAPLNFSVGHNFEQEMRNLWEQALGSSGKLRRMRGRFINAVPLLDAPKTFTEDTLAGLEDPSFAENAARMIVTSLAPGYELPSGFFFRPEVTGDGRLRVETNLDVAAASAAYQALRGPDAGQLGVALILAEMAEIQVDLYASATLDSDVLASDLSSRLFALRTRCTLRTQDSHTQILAFEDVAFEGGSIREAINSGSRTLEEFLPILDKSRQFRDWIRDKPTDVSLARAYYLESVKDSWAEKLPARVFRWLLVLLTGLHVPVAGAAGASALDSIILDRLAKGWRPNHFIDHQIAPFLASRGEDT